MGDKIYFINMIISTAVKKQKQNTKNYPTWRMRSIQTLENFANKEKYATRETNKYFSIILNCRIDWILCFTLKQNKTRSNQCFLCIIARKKQLCSTKNIVPLWDAHCLLVCPLFLTLIVKHTCTKVELGFVWTGTTLTTVLSFYARARCKHNIDWQLSSSPTCM